MQPQPPRVARIVMGRIICNISFHQENVADIIPGYRLDRLIFDRSFLPHQGLMVLFCRYQRWGGFELLDQQYGACLPRYRF